MHKLLPLLVAVCVALAGSMSQCSAKYAEDYHVLYQDDHILEVNIELEEADWQSMLDDPLAEEYKSANITIDGITVENAGVRTKGNLSLNSVASSDSDRYSLRVKFNKYVKGQTYLGLDELVLNNNYSDPSYLREFLSYEALRTIGAPAPLATFANVYINGELFGFYLCVEAVDDSYLERNFGSDKGNLYKADMRSTTVYTEGSDYPNTELNKGDDTEKTSFKNLLKVLNEMPEGEKGDIEQVLDVDTALQYIAVNTVLGNYDSLNGNQQQNYYIYELDGMCYVIPWDYNMSFGGQGGSTTVGIDEPVSGISMDKVPLIKNLLAVEEYKERYHGYIRQLLEYLEGFEERVSQLADLIRPYVEADPTKFYTMEQFESNITYNEEEQTNDFGGGFGGGMMRPDNMGTPPEWTEGMTPPEDMGTPPEGMEGMAPPEDMGTPPEGMEGMTRPDRTERPEGMGGGRGGMMMASGSIVNYVRSRVENIQQQLAGTLPTTGTSTPQREDRPQQEGITVLLDGQKIEFDVQPMLIEDRTMVPLRKIFKALGAQVDWEETTQTVTGQKDGTTITLQIGDRTAYKNNESIELDVPAQIVEDRTLVPVRFIAQSFGCTVEWDESTSTVLITTN